MGDISIGVGASGVILVQGTDSSERASPNCSPGELSTISPRCMNGGVDPYSTPYVISNARPASIFQLVTPYYQTQTLDLR